MYFVDEKVEGPDRGHEESPRFVPKDFYNGDH